MKLHLKEFQVLVVQDNHSYSNKDIHLGKLYQKEVNEILIQLGEYSVCVCVTAFQVSYKVKYMVIFQ